MLQNKGHTSPTKHETEKSPWYKSKRDLALLFWTEPKPVSCKNTYLELECNEVDWCHSIPIIPKKAMLFSGKLLEI